MAGPLRLNPPPLLELNGRWNVEKKVKKKVLFSLMARPLREELFFAASLTRDGVGGQVSYGNLHNSALFPILNNPLKRANFYLFALVMASSMVLNFWMTWTGPKISSRQIFMSSVTSLRDKVSFIKHKCKQNMMLSGHKQPCQFFVTYRAWQRWQFCLN